MRDQLDKQLDELIKHIEEISDRAERQGDNRSACLGRGIIALAKIIQSEQVVEVEPVLPVLSKGGPFNCQKCGKQIRFRRVIEGALYHCSCGQEFYYQ